jgi:indole-3-glycerol phosphate synthase
MSGDLLSAVVAGARRAADLREQTGGGAVLREADERRPRGDLFRATLRAPGVRIIAECKRRSPSRGVLRRDYDPVVIARSYAAGGAAALSVLTEPTFFDGALDHLRAVRDAVDLPILRKDFIVTEFQIAEARAAGADAVLLIVAALDDTELRRLIGHARQLDLAPLVEVHDAEELRRALGAGADLVGVNSRNLRTLEVSGAVFTALAGQLPTGLTAIAESGLRSGDDLRRLHELRYDAFLIGERFMTEPDPGAALAALLGTREAVRSRP